MSVERGLAALIADRTLANRRGRTDWEAYAAHRAALTQAVMRAADQGPATTLMILGAGNGSDLDLPTFAERFTRIHLVDIDGEALARAVARQPATVRERLVTHAPVELSGLLPLTATWTSGPPSAGQIEAYVPRCVKTLADTLPDQMDVVVSDCVLSQMLRAAWDAAGRREQPALAELRRAIGRVHLRTMCGALADGGRALLVTDMASAAHLPALAKGPPSPEMVEQATRAGVVFPGTSPRELLTLLRSEAESTQGISSGEPLPPWSWDLGDGRRYLVSGFAFHRTRRIPVGPAFR